MPGEVPEGYEEVGSQVSYSVQVPVQTIFGTRRLSYDLPIQDPREAHALVSVLQGRPNLICIITKNVVYNSTKSRVRTKPSERIEISLDRLEEIIKNPEPNPTALVPISNPLDAQGLEA